MNKLIKSSLILVIGGLLTKILGMFIRIILTRYLGVDGISLYMLIMPTFSLFISLCQLGLPIAISKLISENKIRGKKILLMSTILSISLNIIIMILVILLSKFISNNLLHDTRTYYPLMCISLVLPFISISSIIRAYFFGKQKMLPHVISNVIEDIIRLILIIICIPIFLKKGIIVTICFLVLSNIVSELSSIIILYFCLPKKISIEKSDIDFKLLKEIKNISLPTLLTRFIGNIGYFLEPIIITNTLLYIGYDSNYIVLEYGIINGYVLPILTLPSFFTNAISSSLLPIISQSYSNQNYIETKKKIKEGILISLLIGIPSMIIIFLFPKYFLNFLYKTTLGINYIKFLAPIFIFSYIQGPLTSIMQGINLSKQAMRGSLIGILIRTILLFICSLFKIGLWGLVISISANILFTTTHHIICIKKHIKN